MPSYRMFAPRAVAVLTVAEQRPMRAGLSWLKATVNVAVADSGSGRLERLIRSWSVVPPRLKFRQLPSMHSVTLTGVLESSIVRTGSARAWARAMSADAAASVMIRPVSNTIRFIFASVRPMNLTPKYWLRKGKKSPRNDKLLVKPGSPPVGGIRLDL